MMLHTKYQGSRPSGFTLEDYIIFIPKMYVHPLCPRYVKDQNNLNTPCREPPNDHLCEINLKWVYEDCHLSQLLMDGRTKTEHKSSHCHL